MIKQLTTVLGALWAIGLLVLALWAWRRGEEIAVYLGAHNQAIVTWSARCAAVALAAAAEGLLAMLVIGNLWRRDAFTSAVGLSAALIFMLSLVSAVALGLAGR